MSDNFETDEFLPISKLDWSFDAVPDTELVACCLWEYARESPTIIMASQVEWTHTRDIWFREAYKNDSKLKAEHDEEAARIERRVKAVGFDYGVFADKFWATDLALIKIYQSLQSYVGGGGRPWQRLPTEARASLAGEVSKAICLNPLADATVGELEELWNANRAALDEVRSGPVPGYDDSEEAALWAETTPVYLKEGTVISSGSMAAAFAIDFTRFTDKEISDSFLGWLKAHRPKAWARPKRVFPDAKQKGRKQIEFRVALERLGLTRLLHWYSPEEIRHEVPPAWTKYGKKKNDFRREVREVTKFFHRLFPFLPPGERPSSETRKGVWFPEMMAICDKVERDMGLR
ncbi:MAG: hypothetical protein MUF81_03880 [Verrucomicrobia bacterium]|jgi:hypothetical protein|nr:hypothetical protein [Verrucomicrobiota bacterium]